MSKVFTQSEHPEITESLLQYLDSVYPLSGFMSAFGVEDVYRYKGHRDVIDHLRSLRIADQKKE